AGLRAGELRGAKREGDGAKTERGVGLVRAVPDGKLVAAQVERPDDDRPIAHLPEDAGVRLEMLLFARQLLTVQVEELGPVEADALAAVSENRGDLFGELDVRPQPDAPSVESDRGQVALLEQRRLADLGLGARRLE